MLELGLAILLLVLPLLFFLTFRVRAGKAGSLRPVPGARNLPGLVARAAETGMPLHVSVGVGGVGGVATVETWAGLSALAHVADEAVVAGAPLLVTVADGTALILAQDLLRRAYERHGHPEEYDPLQVRLVAADALAYAASAGGLVERVPLTGSVLVGSFGDEYLFLGQAGAEGRLPQVAGAPNPHTLPLVYATADEPLLGEEVFALGPALGGNPMQLGSLLTADWLRWLVIAAILGLAALKFYFWG